MLFYVCNCLQSGDWNVLIKSHQISPTFHWCRKAAKIGSLLRISTEIRKLSPSWAHSHLPFSSISQKVHVSNVWRSRLRSVRQNTWSICLPGNAPANDKCARCPHQEESNRNPIESAFNWYRVWFYPVEWLRAFPIHLPSSKLWSTNIDTMDSKCRKDQFHSAFCEHFVNRSGHYGHWATQWGSLAPMARAAGGTMNVWEWQPGNIKNATLWHIWHQGM